MEHQQSAPIDWEEKDELKREVLQYLDVLSLVEKKVVNKNWMKLCIDVINAKSINKKPFETNKELKDAVKKHAEYDSEKSEKLTKLYGWPIGSWDVSGLRDLSGVFYDVSNFNEDISSWQVSNVIRMTYMFGHASAFNQDISTWDVSNTLDMSGMFWGAISFNQDISTWDVSNTFSMTQMFYGASAFSYEHMIMLAWDLTKEHLCTLEMFGSDNYE